MPRRWPARERTQTPQAALLAPVSLTYPPGMELNGTTAIVSGGASGLGEATARELAKAGALVVVADLSEERGRTVADDIGGRFARTDVSDEASVADAVAVAAGTGHPLRVAVSCAGIAWAARTVGRDGTPHDLGAYQKVIAVNLVGTFNLMRLSAAAMAATEPADADGQRGVVINTSSVAGIEGQTGQIAYSASKGGIIGMTVPAARDLAAIGVRVNTICPGHHRHAHLRRGSRGRRVQDPAGRADRVPEAAGTARRVRPARPDADRERLHERRGRPLRRRPPLPAQVTGPASLGAAGPGERPVLSAGTTAGYGEPLIPAQRVRAFRPGEWPVCRRSTTARARSAAAGSGGRATPNGKQPTRADAW